MNGLMNGHLNGHASPPSPLGPPKPDLTHRGARLIAFDGGGVKGVSTLAILSNLMQHIRTIETQRGLPDTGERKPVDYFDLAAGTSTGGLIALMLFRLRMSASEVRAQYFELAQDVFAPTMFGLPFKKEGLLQSAVRSVQWTKALYTGSMYGDEPLKKAIDVVVGRHGFKDDRERAKPGMAPLVHPRAGMMFMCATLADKGEAVLFRSYAQPENARPHNHAAKEAAVHGYVDDIRISTAAQATSAAPFFLPQVHWNPSDGQEQDIVFWDGGMLNNNPINQLWSARYDLVEDKEKAPAVDCVLSLGCSWNTPLSFALLPYVPIVTLLIRAITALLYIVNVYAKSCDFEHYAQRMAGRKDENARLQYFRFDANVGYEYYDMANASKMDDLERKTLQWLGGENVQRKLQECAELLAKEKA